MDFNLNEEQELLKKSIREFAENVILPKVDEMERTDEFPVDLIREMGKVGLLGIITPTEYGGSNMGYLARILAIAEISRISPAIGIMLQVHHMGVSAIQDFGTEEQKRKYLPKLASGETLTTCAVTEPSGGSDLLGMQTTVKEQGDYYILKGRKCFITNAHYSDVFVTVAKVAEGPKGFAGFIIEKDFEGFKLGRKEHKMGFKGANTGELIFNDCKVPKKNLLGKIDAGFKVALKTISEVGRPGMAAISLGILEGCLEESVKYANERTLYGKPISYLQAIQWMISDIYTDLETSKLLCYQAGDLKDKGARCDIESTMAKGYATEAAARSAKKAVELHGSYGSMNEYTVNRYFRDAQICISAGGTTEIAKLVLSRYALKNLY